MMTTSQWSNQKRSKRTQGLDLLLGLMLFTAALGVRWWYASAVVFPPSDEAAFYLTTAENLLTGRGLEVDVVWSYLIPFPGVTHPSHEQWMPLTTGLIAAAWAAQQLLSGALEASLRLAQMPGLILGALLAPLTYLVGRRALPGDRGSILNSWQGSRWVSLGAGLLVAVNAPLSLQSASLDSSAPLVLLTAWALTLAVRMPGDRGGYFGAGLLAALAYLTHAEGVLLLIAIPLAWWLLPVPRRPLTELPDEIRSHPAAMTAWKQRPRDEGSEEEWGRALGPSMIHVLDLIVAFGLAVTPWLLRNYLAFGTPLPGAGLHQLWLSDPVDTFNYLSQPTPQTWLAQGWQAILQQRGQALLFNSGVLLRSTFPWGLLALPGLWLLRREWPLFPSLVYGLLLFFGVALVLPIASMSGAFERSLGVLMPLLALAALYVIQRVVQRIHRLRTLAEIAAIAIVVLLVVMAGKQVTSTLPTVSERQQAEKGQFEAAANWLTQHTAPGDVVMTAQTYRLNYISGQPCIALPGNEPPEAAWQAAQQYGARTLMLTEPFGQYPQILKDQPDPRFRLLEETEEMTVYEIRGD